VIVVIVRAKHVLDIVLPIARKLNDALRGIGGIDDRSYSGFLVSDQVPKIAVSARMELLDQHVSSSNGKQKRSKTAAQCPHT
jgi:hypothetical protein